MNKANKIQKYIRQLVIKEAVESRYIDNWFLEEHLMVVEKIAEKLCKRYSEADREVIMIGVWLHDRARLHGKEKDHDREGAKMAEDLLSELNYSAEKKALVVEACRTHGCKGDNVPQSLEAKILATADALSHFEGIFYERASKNQIENETMQWALIKLKRDFEDKIQFDEIREENRDRYEDLKGGFENRLAQLQAS
jgi:HD superfamily phosphodiesterase